MKVIISFVLLAAFSITAHAADLAKESLQGSWKVITMSGEADEDEDFWEFNGDQFVQNLAGHKMAPDKFSVVGNVIDLDYAKINVLEFSAGAMTAEMAGFKYTLKKK